MGQMLSPKLYRMSEHGMWYWCPGCEQMHPVYISKPEGAVQAVWDWNRDVDKPTFRPSLHHHLGNGKSCHVFIIDGNIQYLNDCHHELRGTTVPMPDIPDDERD